MTIVSNTSPISNLAKVGHIDLLRKLYETVTVESDRLDEAIAITQTIFRFEVFLKSI